MNRKLVIGIAVASVVIIVVLTANYWIQFLTPKKSDEGWQLVDQFTGQGNGTKLDGLCARSPAFENDEGSIFKVRLQFVGDIGNAVAFWIIEEEAGTIFTFGYDQFRGFTWKLKESVTEVETGKLTEVGTFNISVRTDNELLSWVMIIEAKEL